MGFGITLGTTFTWLYYLILKQLVYKFLNPPLSPDQSSCESVSRNPSILLKSETFRVIRIKSCVSAVAAIIASGSLIL